MKKLSLLFLSLTAFIFISCSDDDDKATLVTNFEGKLTEANSEFTTTGGTKINENYYKASFKDPLNIVEFSHYYATWGFGGGFTYSNYTDITTPGFKNISAITAKGKNGSVYMTCYAGNNPIQIQSLKPETYIFKGVWVTNATCAYLAIKDGNDGYYNDGRTKFEADDYFVLTATGYDANDKSIGKLDFYLADFRDGKTKIVNTWEWFDLSAISNADYIEFTLDSTDKDGDWLVTPSYFCMDAITLEEK